MKYNDIKITSKEDSGSEPVSPSEAKAHLRITSTDDDTYITFLIKAARKQLEGSLNRSLVSKTITAQVKNPLGGLQLLYPPVSGINSLADLDGEAISFDADNFILDTTFEDGIIEYETEYVTDENIKFKVLELVAYKYFNRGDATKPTHKASWLI